MIEIKYVLSGDGKSVRLGQHETQDASKHIHPVSGQHMRHGQHQVKGASEQSAYILRANNARHS
jgi:hypothetical protein